MSAAENSWAADTVALGDRRREAEPVPPGKRQRSQKPKRSTPGSRAAATCAVILATLAGLAATLNSDPGPGKAPTRGAAGPMTRVVVRKPMRVRRHKPRRIESRFSRKAKNPLETKREPASIAAQELDEPEPIVETPPEPEPIVEPTPTPPAVEFGM